MIARTPTTAPAATLALLIGLGSGVVVITLASVVAAAAGVVLDGPKLDELFVFDALEDDDASESMSGFGSSPVMYTEKYSPNRLPQVSVAKPPHGCLHLASSTLNASLGNFCPQ